MIMVQESPLSLAESQFSKTVLLVHDRSPLRRELSTELRFTGYRLFEAASVADTVRIAEREAAKQDIHLLVIDIGLIGDSQELVTRMQQLYPQVTTLLLGTAPGQSPEGKNVACLPRPYTRQTFMKAVRDLMFAVRR